MNQIKNNVMYGEETFVWPAGCPSRFRYQCAPHLSHVYCCGEHGGKQRTKTPLGKLLWWTSWASSAQSLDQMQ